MGLVIDGANMLTRRAAHEELARVLGFPEWYGANLDALWDLVSTMKAEVVMVRSEVMLGELEVYGSKLIQTLIEASAENPDFRFTLANE